MQLALFRIGLGLGMGGEWASGAALVAETWRARDRGKALGLMQSAWAIGYGLAALVTSVQRPGLGWRSVFFVGVLPALLTLWIRRGVAEPAMWRSRAREQPRESLWRGPRGARSRRHTALTLMNACTLFAWWGFNLWLPSCLQAAGDESAPAPRMSGFVVAMQVGMWLGYVTFGYVGDRIGRRRAYVTYLLIAAVLMLVYVSTAIRWCCCCSVRSSAFFATGYFSGFGAVTAELYPTAPSAPRPRASPTTSAASPAPPRRVAVGAAQYPRLAAALSIARPPSCSPPSSGS